MKKKSEKSAQRIYVNQCVLQENKSLTSKWEYKVNIYIEDTRTVKLTCWKQYVMAVKANLPSVTRIQCVLTKYVKKPKMFICSQWSLQWMYGQLDQQSIINYAVMRTVNLLDAVREIMTRTVKLQKTTRFQVTRIVNICKMFICDQQQKQGICGQWPNQVLCGYPNQLRSNVIKRSSIKMARTVNLLMNIVAITRNVNLLSIYVTRTVNPLRWVICDHQNQQYV